MPRQNSIRKQNEPDSRTRWSFWLIECGAITLMVFFAMIALTRIQGFPDWAFLLLPILVVLLCFSTLFFLAQRIFRAVTDRKSKRQLLKFPNGAAPRLP